MAISMTTMLILGSGLTASADPALYGLTNPVFYTVIDDQGGAWDTATWYPRENVDLLSGNWRANLRIGSGQAWIDPNYFPAVSVVTTPSQPGDVLHPGGVRSITSTLVNTAPNPYGLPAGAVTIEMDARSVLGTTNLGLRGGRYVVSEPWVMQQSYTIINTSADTLYGLAFYMYYFPSPYGSYPVNDRPSHVDYSAGIGDPMVGYMFDITLYGEGGPYPSPPYYAPYWAYTGLSTNMPPTIHDVGHGGGYPDPPYYLPSPSRPSAISTDVLRQVESDTLRGWASYDAPSGSDPNAVAGAFKWHIGSLAPGASYTITFLQSVAPHDSEIFMVKVVKGRMTGGGSMFTSEGMRVTHGFELHCDASEMPNNLEVNWGKGHKFHLMALTSAFCTDDPTIDEPPPVAGFDTYKGKGTGRYNGVPGATIEFTFTDAGEPGKKDVATIEITDAGGTVQLDVSGNLKNGNHQAHAK